MIRNCVDAILGKRPFDLVIRDVRAVNVFDDTVTQADIGICGGRIAFVGKMEFTYQAEAEIDGAGRYALPGFIDSHMHLESSMLTPAHFAKAAVPWGTTTVAADPHEICNVLGIEGVGWLLEAAKDLPLRVLMMAPSTVPSAPGLEESGYAVGPREMEQLLDIPGIHGLGEVMDFNGVAAGEDHILSVVEAGARRGCILDGHASLLTGRRLQAFRAAGIDSDHTLGTAAKLKEELALGFTAQIQACVLNEELVWAMNTAPVQNRICLVTDDVSLPRLMREGHLNHVVERAIALGLDPMRAIRYATINPAERLRLYDLGAVAPGRVADIQLVEDLCHLKPSLVLYGGKKVYEDGKYLAEVPGAPLNGALRHSVRLSPLTEADFQITCPVPASFQGGKAVVNLIRQDGVSTRTQRAQAELPLGRAGEGLGILDTASYLCMAVFNRYGKPQRGLALLTGMESVRGAVALTYGHDCHNLAVFGSNGADMAAAANAVIDAQGGICAACAGKAKTLIPLPLAGLMSEEEPQALLGQLEAFLADCREMGFVHKDPMAFFTILPLAVSPQIKCTDKGLVDVANKRFLPLIEQIKENG